MDIKNIIEIALKEEELDYLKLTVIAQFNDEETEFTKLFWDQVSNSKFVTITREIVIDLLGYKSSKYAMESFNKKLTEKFEEKFDYREVEHDPTDERDLFCDGNRKYYEVSSDFFKCLLSASKISKGNTIRKLYLKVETLNYIMREVAKRKLLSNTNSLLIEKIEEYNKLQSQYDEVVNTKNELMQSNAQLIKEIESLKIPVQDHKIDRSLTITLEF